MQWAAITKEGERGVRKEKSEGKRVAMVCRWVVVADLTSNLRQALQWGENEI